MLDKIYEFIFELVRKSGMCHQIPERSFYIKGKQFPVCARCTGILLGGIIGGGVFLLGNYSTNNIVFFIMILPLIFDGTIQAFTPYISNNVRRLITGILFGVGSLYILDKLCERWLLLHGRI